MTKKSVLVLLAGLVIVPATAQAQQAVDKGCSPTVANPCTAAPKARLSPAPTEADRVAAEYAAHEPQLAKEAFAQGEAAFAAGKFAAAAAFYLTASRHQPDNAEYKTARARALAAHRQSLGGAIGEITLGGDGKEFDNTKWEAAPRLAIVTVKEPSFADSLAQSFGITVDVNDPKYVGLKLAMGQMEERVKHERFAAMSDGQVSPDPVGLEKSVAAFNETAKAVRPPDAAPVTVEEVETVYTRYKSGLTVKK